MPSAEENKALVRRFLEAQARGDLETLDELMALDFVDRSVLPGQGPTREDYKRSVVEMLAAFSNTSFRGEAFTEARSWVWPQPAQRQPIRA
jgi:ketosteroid isomerase-like protein